MYLIISVFSNIVKGFLLNARKYFRSGTRNPSCLESTCTIRVVNKSKTFYFSILIFFTKNDGVLENTNRITCCQLTKNVAIAPEGLCDRETTCRPDIGTALQSLFGVAPRSRSNALQLSVSGNSVRCETIRGRCTRLEMCEKILRFVV